MSFVVVDFSMEECDLICWCDWFGLLCYGVIFFLLEKFGVVMGVFNLYIYVVMCGELLEDF